MSHLNKKYNCSYEGCSAAFARWDRFEIHIRSHSGEKPFDCSFENCDKKFASASHLKRHEAAHETTFRCPEENCTEILKTKDTLKKHLDVFHHKKKHKNYKCSYCDEEFNKHNWLQRHMFKHTGDHPHKCPIDGCGKGFLMPSRLKKHMRTHSGYTCGRDNCDKVMTTWTLYLKHVRENHPAEHRCDICDRIFSTKCNLKQHKAVHEASRGVFPCLKPNCTRFYYSMKNLNWHVKHYHEARPFICDIKHCHMGFKSEDKLSQHKMTHIRRRSNKKKKPKPSFIALLSGCAQKRVVNRKPRQLSTTSSESGKEWDSSSDDLDLSSPGSRSKKLSPEPLVIDSSKSDQTPLVSISECQQFSTELDVSNSIQPLNFSNLQSKNKIMDGVLLPVSTYLQSNSEVMKDLNSFELQQTQHCQPTEPSTIGTRTTMEPSTSGRNEPLNTSMESKSGAIADVDSSEYEIVTVSLFSAADYKNSESDISSCLSESEDFINRDLSASRQ